PPRHYGVGPLANRSRNLLTSPSHLAQYVDHGLGTEFADAMLRNEPAKLVRFMAFTGGMLLPYYLLTKLGVDPHSILGIHAFGLLGALPFFRAVTNSVNVLTGNNPMDKRRSEQELKKFSAP